MQRVYQAEWTRRITKQRYSERPPMASAKEDKANACVYVATDLQTKYLVFEVLKHVRLGQGFSRLRVETFEA